MKIFFTDWFGYKPKVDVGLERLRERRHRDGDDTSRMDDEYGTQYTAGYNEPPKPPRARSPSPSGYSGPPPSYGDEQDGLRPGYGDSYGRLSADMTENAPLQQSRSMV
jgi:hypothetical protein